MQCTEADCREPALYSYLWPWGAKGLCCSRHQFMLTQTAEHLGRPGQIVWAPLAPGAPQPMQRDERVKLRAQILTMEDELKEARERGLEMYQSNTKLGDEARRYMGRNAELEVQLKEARSNLHEAEAERDRQRAELADAVNDLARLRAVLPKEEPAAEKVPKQQHRQEEAKEKK